MNIKAHYKGLTWDHPRGSHALLAAADLRRELDTIAITWDKQPLEGFEAAPLVDLCARYDLVVMDHPHLGEAYDTGCLMALEDVFSAAELAQIKSGTVGPSAASYRWHDRHWALPLDGATQVCAYRADLLFAPPPVTWEDVLQLAKTSGKVGLSLAGPHAFLTFLSICVALDEKGVQPEEGVLIRHDLGCQAYELMRELVAHTPASIAHLNPIGILDHMAHVDDVALCPLIYGYVTYAMPTPPAKPIHFSNAPCLAAKSRIGTVLGGTGIAISKKCQLSDGLKRHLLWLVSDEAQSSFIPTHQGQPVNRAAWLDEAVNQQANNFYHNTLPSLEAAYIRPRHKGYIPFQAQGAQLLRDALYLGQKAPPLIDTLNQIFHHSCGYIQA